VPNARRSRRGFNLTAALYGIFEVNRVYCTMDAIGLVCVDVTGSGFVGGGFWPRGTPNQYIFGSGLWFAALISDTAGFAWAGDTVGALFGDPSGGQLAGDPVSLVYNSLDPDDLANWPVGAMVRDTSSYSDVLIGRRSVAQQDLWVRTWDGNPTIDANRDHPMGVLLEMRGFGWTFPSGNEDILYFVHTFYNITAEDRSVYAGLHPDIRDSIADIAQSYVAGVEDHFSVDIPPQGYAFEEFYVAFSIDPDVGAAWLDFATAILPFQMGISYKADFLELAWHYPPEIHGPPFYPAPGLVGVKYLKSPIDPATGEERGLTMFSTHTLGGLFHDPFGMPQAWRYMSGNLSPVWGDPPCNYPNHKELRFCYQAEEAEDLRFYQSSGPITLAPGEAASIVVAYVHAAPVAAPLQGKVGSQVQPGPPMSGDSLFADPTRVRVIDSIAGWLSASDMNGNGAYDEDEVVSVERSLLDKALVAQAVFDNKFLLPFAPEVPTFFLVAGDNQATVVWQTSPSETTGDPFFSVASDPTSPLYDPNFRQFDVEGYRIYRGRTSGQLELIAEFDYANTMFTDATGGFAYPGQCAPELGITTDCPSFPNDVPLVGEIIQVPPGGRTELADGSVFIVSADTAVTGGNSGFSELSDTGVPFAYVDTDVLNGFTYHYAVAAYDVNSVASGPTSLESALVTQSVVPRSTAPNTTAPILVASVTGDDGVPLDVMAEWPSIDPDDGTFSGPVPPVNTGLLELSTAAPEALPAGDITVRIDSLDAGWGGQFGDGPNLYVTMSAGDTVISTSTQLSYPIWSAAVNETESGAFSAPLVPYDDSASAILGLEFTEPVLMPVTFSWTTMAMNAASQSVATASGRYGVASMGVSRYLAHSRWYDEGGSSPPDPTITSLAHVSQSAGTLTGVDWIWAPSAYRVSTGNMSVDLRGQGASGMSAWYPGDFVVTWDGSGGISVRDVTHNTDLPFTATGGSGYGFLTMDSVAATGMDQATFDAQVGEYFYLGMSALPAGGTQWHLRAIHGIYDAECTPALGDVMTDCSNYAHTPIDERQSVVPGLYYNITVEQQYSLRADSTGDLDNVHTVPDPYYVTTALEPTVNDKLLQFVNLPNQAVIRVYSLSGILVDIVEHNDPTGGGTAFWNLRNRNEQVVASGVYFYHIETASGQEKLGRFTVVNFAQ
jgi:hypothetical protein